MRNKTKIYFIILAILLFSGSFTVLYFNEADEVKKGDADYQLSYRFRMQNLGPLNLTSVSLRLALLKTWDPVQTVHNISVETPFNYTSTDQYNNSYIHYDYRNFRVNQTVDLIVRANLTIPFLDYSRANIRAKEYDQQSSTYRLYTAFNPLADSTDPGIVNLAQSLTRSTNPIDIAFEAYNFSSTYLKYRLLSNSRGAKFALHNGYGDCDEYTTLFMALLRARGIPVVEHTAWLADFIEGYEGTDDGAAAHAYPMFFVEGIGMLPVDPTRGNKNLFDNFLKTDHKRITLTRGYNQPYRLLRYKWVPNANLTDPLVQSNYTIKIEKLAINFFSTLRSSIYIVLVAIPIIFILYTGLAGRKAQRERQKKVRRILKQDLF